MASFTINAPNGKSYTIEGENAQGALDALKKHLGGEQAAAPDDHGLARRQAMSPLEKAVSPITEYPRNYQEMQTEARDQISRGAGQLLSAFSGAKPLYEEGGPGALWEGVKGAGNVAQGTLGYVGSPIRAAYRSVVGQPVEDVTGIPREYTESGAQLATPGIGFTRLPKAPGAPITPGGIPRIYATKDELPGGTGPSGTEAALAAQRLREAGHQADVPRSITSDVIPVQRTGEWASNVPVVGDPLKQAVHETVPRQLQTARDTIAEELGQGSGSNIANRAAQVITTRAAAERQAAEEAARASDEAVFNAHQRAQAQTEAGIGQAETQSLERARAAVGDMSPQDMGETLITRLRQGEQEARANKDRLYAEAGQSDAQIDVNAVRNVRNHVNEQVNREGITVDPGVNGVSQTPAARSMLTALDRYAELRAPENMVTPPPGVMPAGEAANRVALSVQGIDQMRKHLGNLGQTAMTQTDRRAAGSIMRAFDNWETSAFDNSLFSGSAEGLETLRRARAANRDLMERFGYNADPGVAGAADRILNRIATGEVTPQEVSNWLVGASQVGAKGQSSALLHRITEATRGDPEALQAIRGGVWNRLSQATEGTTAKAPEKIASGIYEFLNGSGRALARELYTPEQHQVMRAYADTLRRGQAARETLTEAAKTSRPSAMTVEPGPMEQLASRIVGGGQKSDEALFRTIHGYAQKGGDVKALAGLMRELPQNMRGDVASSVVRGLGVNRAGQFTLDQFATQWNNITPQAKAILFGNAGETVTSLNDIATIAQRMKDLKGRYGNPSGTAQNSALTTIFATLTGVVGGTVGLPATAGMLGTSAAGYTAARILATPATASSLAKYAKALERSTTSPSPTSQAMTSMAERNLLNTIKTLGALRVPQSSPARLLQGPVPAGAQNEQR